MTHKPSEVGSRLVLLKIEILRHPIYIYMYYTTRIPILVVCEVYIWSWQDVYHQQYEVLLDFLLLVFLLMIVSQRSQGVHSAVRVFLNSNTMPGIY